jgi:AraC-like DNA-binding protein
MPQIRQRPGQEMRAPLCGFSSAQSPGSLAQHAHVDRTQLMYAVSGVMHVTTPAGSWILSSGRALWIEAGAEHGLEVRRPVDLNILYVDPAMEGLPCWPGIKVVNATPLLRELIAAAVDLPWGYDLASPHTRLSRVLVDQLGQMAQSPVDLPQPSDPRARRVADLVRRDPADRTPIAALAPLAGASVRTIERLFLAETRMSFGAWRQRHRLVIALERLAEGQSVGSVSYAVGYESPSSFIAAFKAMFGKTPGTYFDAD